MKSKIFETYIHTVLIYNLDFVTKIIKTIYKQAHKNNHVTADSKHITEIFNTNYKKEIF